MVKAKILSIVIVIIGLMIPPISYAAAKYIPSGNTEVSNVKS